MGLQLSSKTILVQAITDCPIELQNGEVSDPSTLRQAQDKLILDKLPRIVEYGTNVQVCDATKVDSSNNADYIIFLL
jgi:hypothetical protein